MTRRLEITLLRSGVTCTAELLDHRAPMTCEGIWGALSEPVERLALHAMTSGENIFFYNFVPFASAKTLPPENQIVRAGAGVVMFFYRGNTTQSGIEKIPVEWGLTPGDDIYELVFCYGDTDQSWPTINGWYGRHVANIVDNLEAFITAGRRMRVDGAQMLRLSRVP